MLCRTSVLLTLLLGIFVHVVKSEVIKRWKVTPQDWFGTQFDISSAIVYYNNPLKIILEDYNTSTVRCSKENDNKYIFKTTKTDYKDETGNWTTNITVANVTPDMSTKWLCKTIKNFDTPHGFTMTVYVKGLVNVTVGRSRYTATPNTTRLTGLEYDDAGIYQYVVGESVDAVCEAQEPGGEIQLVYYSANGTKSIETDRMTANNTVDFRKTLDIVHDGSMIDCIYSKESLIYTYIIIFKVQTTGYNDLFKITINGMNLVSTDRENANKYQYRYFRDEALQVTCQVTDNLTSNLTISFAKPFMDVNIRSVVKEPGKTSIVLRTAKLNKKHLICRDSANTWAADIRFLLEPIEPRIQGLSGNDVIFRYRKNITTWVLDYSCDMDQALQLICVDGSWSFKDSGKRSSLYIFNSQENETSITCKAKKEKHIQRAILHIFRNTKVPAPHILLPEGTNYWLIGCAAGVSAIAIILVSVIICRSRTRNKGRRQDSLAHLTQNHEVAIPTSPPQWDNHNLYNREVMLNNYLYDVSNHRTLTPKKDNSEDQVYHYPEPVLSNDYAEPVNSIKTERNTEKGYCNLAGSSDDKSLLRRNEIGTVHDAVIKVKRTSEFVEPAYSVLHRS